jgi:hypothetical protein
MCCDLDVSYKVIKEKCNDLKVDLKKSPAHVIHMHLFHKKVFLEGMSTI